MPGTAVLMLVLLMCISGFLSQHHRTQAEQEERRGFGGKDD